MIRTVALCTLLIWFAGCGVAPQPAVPILIHTSVNEAGELWVRVNDGEPHRLLADGQGYRPVLSPYGEWLAVEVRLMSDISVVRLFRREEQRFQAVADDITAVAWNRAATKRNLELDELDRTKVRFFGWSDDGAALELELSALAPGDKGVLETKVFVPLPKGR